MKQFRVWQLAPDEEAYGAKESMWIVVSADGEREYSGAMEEQDAERFAELLNIAAAHGALPDWAVA